MERNHHEEKRKDNGHQANVYAEMPESDLWEGIRDGDLLA